MLKAINLFKRYKFSLNLIKMDNPTATIGSSSSSSSSTLTSTIIASSSENNTNLDESSNKKIKLDNGSNEVSNGNANHDITKSNENVVNNQSNLNKDNVVLNTDDLNKLKPANKKKKYALLIGYCGEGYFGLQRNPTEKRYRTIEDEIVDSLVKINSIPQNHADEMFKMSFQRAARTDKGVSAAQNLLSLKMELADDTIDKLNSILPKQIRVFGYNKVTQSFDCKANCDARTYIYILPTFAFCPIEENLTENFRVSEETINQVNSVLKQLVGTHNFHNFTSGRKYTDPSSKRYIISFECSKPFIKDNYEYSVIKVKGQSFMLHQIRKMIGLTIAVVRGFASLETVELCWTANKVDVPTAPALGLMLDKLHYDKYNRKFGKDGIHQPLEWPELENEIESFKQEYIFSNIIKKEISKKSMFTWLARLPLSHFGVLDPKYMRGSYTGIGKANYLLELLTKNNSDNEEEEAGGGEDD